MMQTEMAHDYNVRTTKNFLNRRHIMCNFNIYLKLKIMAKISKYTKKYSKSRKRHYLLLDLC